MTLSDTLNKYNEQQKVNDLECFKSFTREHDYESVHSQQISTNIIEVEYICLCCGYLKYVYNYLEDEKLE